MYADLSYTQEELVKVMRVIYDELIDFVTMPAFKVIIDECASLHPQERPAFVLSVLLNKEELERRGVHVPDGILIQRSAFGDRRPTLFCVKKYLPEKYSNVWQNVNLTFDNKFIDESVSRAPEIAWRKPLSIHEQVQIMAAGGDLEQIGLTH